VNSKIEHGPSLYTMVTSVMEHGVSDSPLMPLAKTPGLYNVSR
jgi:hypothetical protein